MDLNEQRAIAKGKLLGYLLMNKNPLALNVIFAAEKLQLEPEEISAALWDLSDEGRIDLVLSKAIVTLRNAPKVLPESVTELQDVEVVANSKKGRSHESP